MINPPHWTAEEIVIHAFRSVEDFIAERTSEPLEVYLDIYEDARDSFDEFMAKTNDLLDIEKSAVEALTDPRLLEVARYLAGPPVSLDDLKEIVLVDSLAPTKLRKQPQDAVTAVETILLMLDRARFPWVIDSREPDEQEMVAARTATAAMIANSKTQTLRRNTSKTKQEDLAKEALRGIGFKEVATRMMQTIRDAPNPGEFCGESKVGTRKADVVASLWDGRLLLIECKVSNSSTNSVKRLNNDAESKAGAWLREFGAQQIVPSALLSGVFKPHNLMQAQANGLTIWWAHDLKSMTDWIEMTRGS